MSTLQLLKRGYEKLKAKVKPRADSIQTKLKKRQSISSEDERWLDSEGNIVDEDRVMAILDGASDCDRAIGKLSEKDKTVAEKLKQLAGQVSAVGNKRKRMF